MLSAPASCAAAEGGSNAGGGGCCIGTLAGLVSVEAAGASAGWPATAGRPDDWISPPAASPAASAATAWLLPGAPAAAPPYSVQ
jgi:hypothetical protein